ncbi:hypothetical protein DM02DRAFT_671679 [Periconia macrospinosa]|uniref:GATA-type domain-containing protein n=1 Tax=Periconia macrospinosa TaxID=97972 RepID=A0A2V1DS21_9PLEO|nr:hypothetical protein DM02DRAFT_671679 [Periconia macrospinosa]
MHNGADMTTDLFPALPDRTNSKPTIPPTRYTRQFNWEQRALDGLPDFLHIFSLGGAITFVSNSCNAVTKYQPYQLLGRPIAEFIHPDDYGPFTNEVNESILTLKSARFYYRFRSADGNWIVLEAQCRPFIIDALDALASHYAGMGFQDVVVMARPYPTRNASLLDSFLELKMENERLQRQIQQLQREACEDEAIFNLQQQSKEENSLAESLFSPSSISNRTIPERQSDLATHTPARKFTAHVHVTLSQDTVTPQSKPHIKLENRDDEVSSNLLADQEASVVLGDLGIPISKYRATTVPAPKRKRNAPQFAEPRVCTSCGTSSSPEWRKGPEGPKTLCNACGSMDWVGHGVVGVVYSGCKTLVRKIATEEILWKWKKKLFGTAQSWKIEHGHWNSIRKYLRDI